MARVTGPSRTELDARGDEFAARVSRAIRTTLRDVAATTRDVDDLTRIQTVWRSVVVSALAPRVRAAWNDAIEGVRVQLEKINAREQAALVAAVFEIPKVSNPLAEVFLAESQNRLVAIGDVVWYTARGEMLTGLQLGEGVAELKDRVIASADVSVKRAETIARTEVNSAMNNGAYEQMKALDVPTIKEWIATEDTRTRESHREVDGAEIAGDAKFTVGGFPMDHPHDLNAPPSQTVNCRCTLAWEIIEDDDDFNELTAAGDFDESKHPRDGKGRFAEKAGTGYKVGKKLKITKSWTYQNRKPGTVVAVSDDGRNKVVFTGTTGMSMGEALGPYKHFHRLSAEDEWKPGQVFSKAKAFEWFENSTTDGINWHEPSDDNASDDAESDVGSASGPLEITQDIFDKKYNLNDVVLVGEDKKDRVIWDGKHYRQQRWNGLIWSTQQLFTKDEAAEKIKSHGGNWYLPTTPPTTKAAESTKTAKPAKKTGPTKKASKSSGASGTPLKITHGLVHSKHEPGTVIAENGAGDKRVVWDGAEYRLQRKKDDGTWTTEKKVKKSKAYVEVNAYDSDWREPGQADDSSKPTSTQQSAPAATTPALAPAPTPAASSVTPSTLDAVEVSEYPQMDPTFVKQAPYQKGGIFENKYGAKFKVTPTQSLSHARNELLASQLYAYAAIGVEHVKLVQTDSNKLNSPSGIGVQTSYKPGEVSLTEAMKTNSITQKTVNENFAFDAWLGNWDVVGLGYENLKVDEHGIATRSNLGGALLYRANGQPKGAAFGDTVGEIDSLRDPHLNPSAAKVFADVTDEDIRAGVARIEKITPDDIDYLVSKAGFTGKEADLLSSRLQARRADLISKYGSDAPKPAQSTGPAPSTLPTATNALGGTTKTYTASQKAKVQAIFNKHNLKWHNKTDQIYDAAHEVSTKHSDLTMADALNIMDQSLKKKTDNPFRTKVEKWLKTKAGKNHVLTKGGSASIGGTAPKVPATPATSGAPSTGKYQSLNSPSATAMQKQMDEETPPPWTAEQRTALRTYTGGQYTTINQCARGTKPCDPTTKKTLDDIKEAMKPSTRAIKLYRATNPASFGFSSGDEMEAMLGKTISDNGVISTSITKIGWSGQIKLEIEVPKGSQMAWVQPISLHPSENEMVLAPGTHYEVVGYKKVDGYYGSSYEVKLRVIPGSDTRTRELQQQQKELVSA